MKVRYRTIERIVYTLLILASFLGVGVLSYLGYEMGRYSKNPFTKIHPTSYLILFIFFGVFFNTPLTLFKRIIQHKLLIIFFLILLISSSSQVLLDSQNSISFIIDTLLLPFVFSISLRTPNGKSREFIHKLLEICILTNSVLAIVEFILKVNFFPINYTYGLFFRSTSFLGHPLNNGLITFVYIIFSYTKVRKLSFIFILKTVILFSSLLCFGARFSFLCAIIFLLYSEIISGMEKVDQDRYSKINIVTKPIIKISFISLLLCGIFFSEMGTRIRSTDLFDANANVRLESVNILEFKNLYKYLTPTSLLKIEKLKRFHSINIIENYFIQWVLSFGFILASGIFIFLYANMFRISKHLGSSNLRTHILLLFFFLVSLSNNSLATSTSVIILWILLVYANIGTTSRSFLKY